MSATLEPPDWGKAAQLALEVFLPNKRVAARAAGYRAPTTLGKSARF